MPSAANRISTGYSARIAPVKKRGAMMMQTKLAA